MKVRRVEYHCWNAFNFFVRRVLGVFWLLGGAFGSLWSLVTLFNPSATIDIDGVPSNEWGVKVLFVCVFLLIAVFGWFFTRASKYYPPKVLDWMKENNLGIDGESANKASPSTL